MINHHEKLFALVKTFPTSCGCYLYRSFFNDVLYVGKAKNLRSRVSQYFQKSGNNRVNLLIKETSHIEFIVTNNEMDCLILENQLIKKYLPKYNVLLKDDKHFPYIVITNEKYPRLTYVRKYIHQQNTLYKKVYGPFPNGFHALGIVDLLNQIFPFRKCKNIPGKPCLYWYIHQCLAPCIKDLNHQVKPEEYNLFINGVDDFFKGNDKQIQNYLKKNMQIYVEKLEFENANKLKKLSTTIKEMLDKQKIEYKDNQNCDFIGHFYQDQKLAIYILFYRQGKFQNHYFEIIPEFLNISETINIFLKNLYQQNQLPHKIVYDQNLNLDDSFFTQIKKIVPKSNKYRELLDVANKNAAESFLQNNLRYDIKIQQSQETIQAIKEIFQVKEANNLVMEMVDTSHFYGTNYVGAVSHFVDLEKNYYNFRKYKLPTISSANDPLSIYITLEKHFSQMKNFPNIFLIDGGQTQLNAAINLKNTLSESIPQLIKVQLGAMVKNDAHQTHKLLLSNGKEYFIEDNKNVFLFLAKMQDVTHNYAITYFRQRQLKTFFNSEIANIKGIGKKTESILNQNYKTVEEIKQASVEELSKIINKNIAVKIYEHFH